MSQITRAFGTGMCVRLMSCLFVFQLRVNSLSLSTWPWTQTMSVICWNGNLDQGHPQESTTVWPSTRIRGFHLCFYVLYAVCVCNYSVPGTISLFLATAARFKRSASTLQSADPPVTSQINSNMSPLMVHHVQRLIYQKSLSDIT